MPEVLIASDAPWIVDEVLAAVAGPGVETRVVPEGREVLSAVQERAPDLVVTDLQIGSMGGMAVSLDLRLEEGMDRLPHVPVLMLLDRRADVFLARRSRADGWLVKPLDAFRLRKAFNALLDGRSLFEGVPEDEWPALADAARGQGGTAVTQTLADSPGDIEADIEELGSAGEETTEARTG